jgi:hypothetical protein
MVSDNWGVNIAFAATFNGGQDVFFQRLSAVVPEPSTFLIWSLGLIGLAWYARRRRTK